MTASPGTLYPARRGAALRMSPEFWLNAQQAVDVEHAARRMKKVPAPVPFAG